MRSVLVTGASRGIGLEFVRQLAGRTRPSQHVVFASCRDPEKATKLQELASSNESVKVLKIDVTDEDTHGAALETVENVVGENGLNVLINNAGLNRGGTVKYGDLTRREILEVFDVNTVAPIRLTETFLPLIKKAANNSPVQTMSAERAAICNISSSLGSITQNSTGGFAVYRESKAALNMVTKTMSIDLKKDNILVMSLCPGWVRTDMGGPHAVHTAEETVTTLLTNISTATEEHHGKFFSNTIPIKFYEF